MALLAPWRRSGPFSSSDGSFGPSLTTYPKRRRYVVSGGGLGYFYVAALCVIGFVGLLAASFYLPLWATPLRIAALGWFIGLGALRVALAFRR